MARIRSTKPEFWKDEELAERFPRDARMLYMGLWNLSDEHGRLRGNPKYIKGELFPYDDDLDADAIDYLLELLAKGGKAVRYSVNGMSYMFLPNLAKHQRLDAAKVESKLPGPDDPGSELVRATEDDPHGSIRINSDESARKSDDSARTTYVQAGTSGYGHEGPTRINPDESGPIGADKSVLLYGTGSMEHVHVDRTSPADVHADQFALIEDPPSYERGSDDDPKWREFWAEVWNKDGKVAARDAWANHILGKGTYKGKPIKKTDPDIIIAGMRAYVARKRAEGTERRHIKQAQGWLNERRWEDEQERQAEQQTAKPTHIAEGAW